MIYFTVRDLRSKPGQVWKTIEKNKEAVITNNGKPSVLMLDLKGKDPEEMLAGIRQFLAMQAINNMRMHAVRNGLDKLTDEEIEEEIAAARKERREK